MKNVKLQLATIDHLVDLQSICRESYIQVFASHWNGNGLELYLESVFGTARLQTELVNEDYGYHFIVMDNIHIGFVKVNFKTSEEFSILDNCELEKIYILPAYSGMGIGQLVMEEIINEVRRRGKQELFLSVIETNRNAINFYKKLDFKFHSTTRLDIPQFKEELRGMHRMHLTTK